MHPDGYIVTYLCRTILLLKAADLFRKVSVYDQEIPQSHTADQATAPRGRATEKL